MSKSIMTRFQDEREAWDAAFEWINEQTPLPTRIESYGLRFDDPSAMPRGGVKVVWDGGKLIGVVTVVRDDHNYSILSICEGDHE